MAPVRERDRAASSGERRIALLALAAAILLGCAGPPPSTRGEAAQPFIRVGPNVRVSTAHSTDTHYEVVVAAHPHDSSRLIIGSIIYPESAATYGTVVYHSRDGGAGWTQTLGLPALDRTGDPAMAFGPDGVAYYVASSLPAVGERRLKLFRSTDGGGMWDGPHPLTYMDREYVTVDATAGRNRGRVYVNGNNRVPRTVSDFVVFTSTDGGRVFSGPGTRSAFGSVHATVMGNAVVVSDGTLVGVYVEASPRAGIHATWSADGGASLASSARIDDYVAGGERKGAQLGNANVEPALAIDASGGRFTDRLYVVWPDRRSGHSQILFSSSMDRGRTWSPGRAINDNTAADLTDQFMPEIAVNGAGVVGVTWYDRREHPDNLGWDVRFTASLDGGASFLPSVKVSERGASFPTGASRQARPPTRPGEQQTERAQIDVGRDSFTFMGGDTAGLAADASGVFHAVWVDNRTGVPQVWTTVVAVK